MFGLCLRLKALFLLMMKIRALDSLKTKDEAVIRKDAAIVIPSTFEKDSTATIQLTSYDVTSLVYQTNTNKPQFAVFSEIYYKNGWNAIC